jgi:hypothetical protein
MVTQQYQHQTHYYDRCVRVLTPLSLPDAGACACPRACDPLSHPWWTSRGVAAGQRAATGAAVAGSTSGGRVSSQQQLRPSATPGAHLSRRLPPHAESSSSSREQHTRQLSYRIPYKNETLGHENHLLNHTQAILVVLYYYNIYVSSRLIVKNQ